MVTLPTLVCFARSGGTLINKIVGSHPKAAILSEVNPAGNAVKGLLDQAHEWLGLISENEKKQMKSSPFGVKIKKLKNEAAKGGRLLILRDWVTVNFFNPFFGRGNSICPSQVLETQLYLSMEGITWEPLVVARRCLEVFQSYSSNIFQLEKKWEDKFFQAYLAYAKQVHNFPKISIEELQVNPTEETKKILSKLGLPSENIPELLNKFQEFDRCTGNNTLHSKPLSAEWKTIQGKNSKRNKEPLIVSEVNRAAAETADKLLGYKL